MNDELSEPFQWQWYLAEVAKTMRASGGLGAESYYPVRIAKPVD